METKLNPITYGSSIGNKGGRGNSILRTPEVLEIGLDCGSRRKKIK